MHVARSIPRHRFLAGAFVASATALLRGVTPAVADGARTGPWCRDLTKGVRETSYDFSLNLLDGKGDVFTLSDLVGRPVWLNFFATWCPPCNAEMSDIIRLASRFAPEIHVIGIDVAEEPAKVRAFRDRHSVPFPIALDEKASVFHSFGFSELPTHMFLDARGYISCISVGDLLPNQMDNEIAVALSRKPMPHAKSVSLGRTSEG